MNSTVGASGSSCVEERRSNSLSAPGSLMKYARKPSASATTNENTSASNMPRIDATLLTTAFEERSELRSKRHLSQISVRSCDIDQGL